MEPDFIIVACGNSLPHEAHEWREGFLGLRKKKCGGRPHLIKHLIPDPDNCHHLLKLHMYPKYVFINPLKVVLHCSRCSSWFSSDKDVFYSTLLSGRPSGINIIKDFKYD